jgi:hypothetical protein
MRCQRREGRAMALSGLPEDGEFRFGSVILADGRQFAVSDGLGDPVVWVTTQPVPDAGMVWSALSDAQESTGLVPFLLPDLVADFGEPADVAGLDHMDAAELLEERWDGEMPSDYEDREGGEPWTTMRAPFSRTFPGLAPAEDQHLSQGQREQALSGLPPAHIGLVAARKSADVLALIGYQGSDQFDNALPIATVVRSWEDRFWAKLLRVDDAEIQLLAERPPHTVETAQRLAAEIFAFCDEYGGQGLHDIAGITAALMSSPIWTFWWD